VPLAGAQTAAPPPAAEGDAPPDAAADEAGAEVGAAVPLPLPPQAASARLRRDAAPIAARRERIMGSPAWLAPCPDTFGRRAVVFVRHGASPGTMPRARRYRSGVPAMTVDAPTLRFLERHETRAHAATGREVVELPDAIALFDPADPEPFWNRAASLRFPTDADAFDRRLTELLALFAVRQRTPHVWPSPAWNQPADLVDRLVANGFRDAGGGFLMVLADPSLSPPVEPDEPSPEVTLEQLTPGDAPIESIRDAATILAESFATEPWQRDDIVADLAQALGDPAVAVVLARVDGEPAAMAKATTFDRASYLASIGTRPRFRGRGLAALVTRMATVHGLAQGARWVYLGVFSENETAVRLYRRLGFEPIGDAAPDLLLT
jgi:RimJ/RimL family protein N-acetyltransferase